MMVLMPVRRLCLAILACLTLSFGVFVQAVSAQTVPYDSGPYGRCTYSIGCPQHTIITTPSGLDVAVNLTNGQVIPAKGYTIIVTPLNGSGSSFKTVDFYIDGQLAHSMPPAEDGTASWLWDPRVYPGTTVKITVTDTDGQTITKTFHVSFTTAGNSGGLTERSGQSGNGGSNGSGGSNADSGGSLAGEIPSFVGSDIIPASVKHFIQRLPGPIVYSFPYLLFVLLAIEAYLLARQARRELNERRTLERLIERERQIAELRQTFLQLVSHYLRTPLTVLRSGAEGLPDDGAPASVTGPVQQEIEQLRSAIETFIGRVDTGTVTTSSRPVIPSSVTVSLSRHQAGRLVAIWLPVLLIGVLAFFFTYAAGHITRFSTNAIEAIIQFLVFAVLAAGIYQLLRSLQLRRRDTLNARAVHAEEQAVQANRDAIADEAAAALQARLNSLDGLIAKLPQGLNSKFVRKGFSQLKATYGKFIIASRLRSGHSEDRYTTTTLKSLYDQASASVTEDAQKKHLTLSLENDVTLSTQSASLITLVLESLLDNAVAYSAEGGSVTVSGTTDGRRATVTVTDHGQGIPGARLAELFQPFTKVEGAETFNHEGMGFSLYLDRLIMAYLNGDIQLLSEPGKATAATFSWALAV